MTTEVLAVDVVKMLTAGHLFSATKQEYMVCISCVFSTEI